MESGFIALIFIITAVATAIGVLIGMYINSSRGSVSKTHGVIHVIYDTLSDQPSLYLNLDVPVTEITSCKRAVFDVNAIEQNSHK